jgi:hypothetical protein
MRKITYLLMFFLIASGSILSLFSSFVSFNTRSSLIVSILDTPIGKFFLGIPTYLPHFAIVLFKWLMLLLILNRLIVFLKIKAFAIPSNYKGIWVMFSLIGIIAFTLGAVSIKLYYTSSFSNLLPDNVWHLLFNNGFSVAANILPLTFTLSELIAIKNLTYSSVARRAQ